VPTIASAGKRRLDEHKIVSMPLGPQSSEKLPAISPDMLAALLATHAGALALYARQWCDRPDDVVQEAFVQLARQPTVPDDPPAWLYRVVRNAAHSAVRADSRRRRREQAAAAERSGWLTSEAETQLDAAVAVAALESLDEELRETVTAHLWGGLTFEQIAGLMSTSASTAHRRYEQGLRLLRERLERTCLPNDKNLTDRR
jgi:RNA polymerase sigma factor (sigma-70 family)